MIATIYGVYHFVIHGVVEAIVIQDSIRSNDYLISSVHSLNPSVVVMVVVMFHQMTALHRVLSAEPLVSSSGPR